MTIKTLTFIHQQLKAAEAKAYAEYDAARKLWHEYEDSPTPDRELIKGQKAAADELREIWNEAEAALADFQEQEW